MKLIWFYRDFLDGPVYIIVAILSIIFIMAIIGFIMERLQLEHEEKNRVAVLQNEISGAPINANLAQTPASVAPTETLEAVQKPENAVTNEEVPAVLDLNAVEEKNK